MGRGKDSSMKELVKMLDTVGWDKGISALEKIYKANENLQADLYSNPETVSDAAKLGITISQQGLTIARLKKMQQENSNSTK